MPRLKLSYNQIKDARAVLEAAPHLQLLHFTANGDYYVQAYPYKKEGETEQKLYGRVGLLHTAANKPEAIVDQFLIVKTYTREEILGEGFTGIYDEAAASQEEKPEGLQSEDLIAKVAGDQVPKSDHQDSKAGAEAPQANTAEQEPASEPVTEVKPEPEPEAAAPAAAVEPAAEPHETAQPGSPTEIHPSQQN